MFPSIISSANFLIQVIIHTLLTSQLGFGVPEKDVVQSRESLLFRRVTELLPPMVRDMLSMTHQHCDGFLVEGNSAAFQQTDALAVQGNRQVKTAGIPLRPHGVVFNSGTQTAEGGTGSLVGGDQ